MSGLWEMGKGLVLDFSSEFIINGRFYLIDNESTVSVDHVTIALSCCILILVLDLTEFIKLAHGYGVSYSAYKRM